MDCVWKVIGVHQVQHHQQRTHVQRIQQVVPAQLRSHHVYVMMDIKEVMVNAMILSNVKLQQYRCVCCRHYVWILPKDTIANLISIQVPLDWFKEVHQD
jgi:hypothetical protein